MRRTTTAPERAVGTSTTTGRGRRGSGASAIVTWNVRQSKSRVVFGACVIVLCVDVNHGLQDALPGVLDVADGALDLLEDDVVYHLLLGHGRGRGALQLFEDVFALQAPFFETATPISLVNGQVWQPGT